MSRYVKGEVWSHVYTVHMQSAVKQYSGVSNLQQPSWTRGRGKQWVSC